MRGFSRALALTALLVAPIGHADILLIQAIERDQQLQQERPRRGSSMEAVGRSFGTPEQVLPAVGEPPITRWVYPDFTVVFEHDKVIHTVTRRQ